METKAKLRQGLSENETRNINGTLYFALRGLKDAVAYATDCLRRKYDDTTTYDKILSDGQVANDLAQVICEAVGESFIIDRLGEYIQDEATNYVDTIK